MLKLFGLRKCTTCQKAMDYLDRKKKPYDFSDVKEERLSKEQVTKWSKALGGWEKTSGSGEWPPRDHVEPPRSSDERAPAGFRPLRQGRFNARHDDRPPAARQDHRHHARSHRQGRQALLGTGEAHRAAAGVLKRVILIVLAIRHQGESDTPIFRHPGESP
ncbi:MAG: hypothetical protein E6G89_11095 [Alphaproteobacteria bacterium]|nr:MAG: hypothetical protein E6G89_11095 [Alphaproteobacteria bacterium]